jgi:DNA-binding MarR family transcriptional regulator
MPSRDPRIKQIHAAIDALRGLADAFDRRRATLAREAGLTVEGWRALETIATEHFVPSMFARRRRSSAAAVSKILRRLSADGLVRPSVAPHDARGRIYRLTARGRRRLDALRRARFRAIDAIWRALPAREVETFARFAAALLAQIERFEAIDASRERIALAGSNRRG